MRVKAKWNIAYKGTLYKGGDIFEMGEKDYPAFRNDVLLAVEADNKAKKPSKPKVASEKGKYNNKMLTTKK